MTIRTAPLHSFEVVNAPDTQPTKELYDAQDLQKQQQQHEPPVYEETPSITPINTRAAPLPPKFTETISHDNHQPASNFHQRFHSITSKVGKPLNKAANVIGAEGWWPTNMERESSKAARILHSFTSLGVSQPPTNNGPVHPTGLTRKSIVKIPDAVLRNCAGLAIFNVIRAGAMHGSLAAGSGVVLARRADGTWSPPSSFVVSTIGAGFVFGLDIYDCVCVLNTPEQVSAFTNPRFSLGGEASIAIGPVGTGAHVDAAVSKTVRPMWSYMKSRGLWAGVQIDGTVIVSRADANAVFYGERGISARRILRHDVAWPMKAKPLFEVLKAIERLADFDRGMVQEVGMGVSPGDTAVFDEKHQMSAVEIEVYADETILDEKQKLAKEGY